MYITIIILLWGLRLLFDQQVEAVPAKWGTRSCFRRIFVLSVAVFQTGVGRVTCVRNTVKHTVLYTIIFDGTSSDGARASGREHNITIAWPVRIFAYCRDETHWRQYVWACRLNHLINNKIIIIIILYRYERQRRFSFLTVCVCVWDTTNEYNELLVVRTTVRVHVRRWMQSCYSGRTLLRSCVGTAVSYSTVVCD